MRHFYANIWQHFAPLIWEKQLQFTTYEIETTVFLVSIATRSEIQNAFLTCRTWTIWLVLWIWKQKFISIFFHIINYNSHKYKNLSSKELTGSWTHFLTNFLCFNKLVVFIYRVKQFTAVVTASYANLHFLKKCDIPDIMAILQLNLYQFLKSIFAFLGMATSLKLVHSIWSKAKKQKSSETKYKIVLI